jgi:arylsulfatase A-like enzyme
MGRNDRMSTKDSRTAEVARPELKDAYGDLLAGRLDRRQFLNLAVGLGLSAAAARTMAGMTTEGAPATAGRRPNILLILADDLGFGDLGAMGSEIRTPNIDSIARNGKLFTSMYNSARCCPTRSALLTGLYPHNAGLGHMGSNLGTTAYQGYLRDDAATIAEALRAGGYRTLMAGKWHVGGDLWATRVASWRPGDPGQPTPLQRGFDHFFGMLDGVAHYFSPWYIRDDDQRAEIPQDFYLTDAITDRAIRMLEVTAKSDQPFFMYLAHHAPHWPLHALPEDIERYAGTYIDGWEKLRGARYEEMRHRGILQHPWQLSPRDADAGAWSDSPHKRWEAQRMAVYAAQVDRMDQQIGRVLQTLKRLGKYEDTIVLFLSDNGGCAETMREGGWTQFYPDTLADGRKVTLGNRPGLEPGGATTFMTYDLPWANASNTPFRLFKHYVHEGGISTPLLVQWPARIAAGGVDHTTCHVIDIVPTLLEAAGVAAPKASGDHAVQAPDGESLLPRLLGRRWQRDQALYWEHEGNCAVRADQLKLVRRYGSEWELYDMEKDRTELRNLAKGNRRLVARLSRQYEEWGARVGVVDWKIQLPKIQKAWNLEEVHG